MKAHAAKSASGMAGGAQWAGGARWRGPRRTAGGGSGRGGSGGERGRRGRSAARREADRARAVLWSLEGETSPAIAARLGVRAEQVRRWRAAFRSGGVEALRSRPRPGRTPRKREAALAVAGELLKGGAADRPVW